MALRPSSARARRFPCAGARQCRSIAARVRCTPRTRTLHLIRHQAAPRPPDTYNFCQRRRCRRRRRCRSRVRTPPKHDRQDLVNIFATQHKHRHKNTHRQHAQQPQHVPTVKHKLCACMRSSITPRSHKTHRVCVRARERTLAKH